MADNSKPPRKVGYGVPPEHSRFPKGKSGNPQGRPKGSKNFVTEIEDELKALVPVTENGKRKKISKRKVIAKQLVNKAAAGDAKAIPILLQHDVRFEESRAANEAARPQASAEEDMKTIATIIKRMREVQVTPSQPEPEPPAETQPSTSKPEEESKP